MTTNDERLDGRADLGRADTAGAHEDRTDVLPEHYQDAADPQGTGVITSGHPERVSQSDVPDADPSGGSPAGIGAAGIGASGVDPSGVDRSGVDRSGVDASDAWDRLAMDFVDDPRGAVAEAARLVREAVERTTSSSSDGDTEGLRTAFRRLRDLHRTLVTH